MMQTHWAADYLGKPWQSGAAGPVAFDCWGLVRAVYRARLAIAIPPVACDAMQLRAVRRAFADPALYTPWHQVDEPQDLDAVLMAATRRADHVGLFIESDGGRILHAAPKIGVIAQGRVDVANAGYRILGFYRHIGRFGGAVA